MADTDTVTITIDRRTLEAAIACVEACSNDQREPQRYREKYAEALAELRSHA